MKHFLLTLALVSTVSLASAQSYIAVMDGAQDGGGLRMGGGTVNLTLTGTTLSLAGSFSGLTANATAAHIHGPAGLFPAAAGVIYNLGSISTLGGTSGGINGNVTLVPGAFTVPQQIADLNNSLWYINVHNASFPGGEIRGQILPVPEPATWALGGLGILGLLAWRRRK